MKQRVLFHLRLEACSARRDSAISVGSATTAEGNQQTSTVDTAAGALQRVGRGQGKDEQQGGPDSAESVLACTCIDSSSESCVVVGFEQGLVHVYDRVLLPNSSHDTHFESEPCDLEEARWKHTAVCPTRALSNSYALLAPPDITCVQRGPGGMLAMGTSDGLVFVTQVICRCLLCSCLVLSCGCTAYFSGIQIVSPPCD